MALLEIPRVLISGFVPSDLIRNFGIGIIHELRKANHSVACATSKTDFISSAILERLSLRPVACLSSEYLSRNRIGAMACVAASGADFLIVLGVGDLAEASSYDQTLAEALGCKIIALTDKPAKKPFDPRVEIEAEILVADENSNSNIGSILGSISKSELRCKDVFSASFLNQAANISRSEILRLSLLVEENINLAEVEKICKLAGKSEIQKFSYSPKQRKTRIAVARDGCFSGGFADNLLLLRYYGADLVEFSPISDKSLPDGIGGVYLPAPYLKEYAQSLADNKLIRKEIHTFAKKGGVVFSEGLSTAYLSDSFKFDDTDSFDGVGILPGSANILSSELKRLEVLIKEDCIFGYPGLVLKGLGCKNWNIKARENILTVFEMSRADYDTIPEGYSPGAQIICTFSILHFGTCRVAVNNIVNSAEVFKRIA
ncbi:MAG: hypothetical protein KDD56_06390 [Bdellovibrionales bacterium]|nr:hypothetical protein [Bdellovibrionales bacterium]